MCVCTCVGVCEVRSEVNIVADNIFGLFILCDLFVVIKDQALSKQMD